MPESAAGNTTRSAVFSFPAPIAYEPSRSSMGTARIASSLSELTYGTIITPMISPALSMLNAGRSGKITCSFGVIVCTAK